VDGGNIETEWATYALQGKTLRVTKDMLLRRFTKSEFDANYIVYAAGFQRPASGDKWTEGNASEWYVSGADSAVNNEGTIKIVGNYSINLRINPALTQRLLVYPYPIQTITFKSAGYVDCIPTDIGKNVYDDGVFSGTLLTYNNVARIWTVKAHLTIAGDSAMTITLGTGAGTADGDSADNSLQLGLDITKIGTPKTIPVIDFYAQINDQVLHGTGQITVMLGTGKVKDGNYFYYTMLTDELGQTNKMYHISLPIGPYFNRERTDLSWWANGSPNWNQIDYIALNVCSDGEGADLYVGLKFCGELIRGAYDSIHIGINKCKMKLVRDTISKDDSLIADDDSGTIGLFALAELLKAIKTPLTGQIVIPLSPEIMAGQLVNIKASRNIAGAEIDGTMRILEVRHNFSVQATTTTLTLSDDLSNSYPMLPSDAINAILKATDPTRFQDRTRGSLIGSDIDILQTILAKDYDTSN
jgi:hypothetical protein